MAVRRALALVVAALLAGYAGGALAVPGGSPEGSRHGASAALGDTAISAPMPAMAALAPGRHAGDAPAARTPARNGLAGSGLAHPGLADNGQAGSGQAGKVLAGSLVAAAPTGPGESAAAAGPAPKAVGTTLVRLGDHADFGRVVLQLPAGVPAVPVAQGRRDGDRLILSLAGAGDVVMAPVAARARRSARHVLAVAGGRDQAVLTLDPGSVTRIWRMGPRIVVDVYGAEAAARMPPSATLAGTAQADATSTGGAGGAGNAVGAGGAGGAGAELALAAGRRDRAAAAAAGEAQNGSANVARASPAGGPAGMGHEEAMGGGKPLPGARSGVAAQAAAGTNPDRPAATDPGTGSGARAAGDGPPTAPDPGAETPAVTAERIAGQGQPDGAAPDAAGAGGPATADDGEALALRAVRLAVEPPTIMLPFAPRVGAAAFAHGGLAHAVFDDSKAIDLSPLRGDAVFGSARITLLPAATHLTMTLSPGARLALHRRADGWLLSVEHDRQQDAVAQVRLNHGVLSISARAPADNVVLIDANTGGKLLIGTVRNHGVPVAIAHASPEFALLPSWEGVAVAAVSDRLGLSVAKGGFALQTTTGPPLDAVMVEATEQALETSGVLTRRFDFPLLDTRPLLHRLEEDSTAAALAPRQGRFAPRLRAAQDMLALGMDREAASLLKAARQDDPSQDGRADVTALQGIARFLVSGDGSAAAALASPSLGTADEVALWRALIPAQSAQMTARAAVLAADWRLLLGYPAPLRARLLPVAADILTAGNQLAAADALLATDPSPGLDPSRARLLQAQGKAADALAVLDALAAGADRKRAAEAVRDATDIRLATKRLTAAQAARALQKTFYAWREPGFEVAQRLRAAALLTDAGDFRAALAQLREMDRLFPEAHASVHAAEQHTVQALVQAGSASRLAPLDLVALVDENADLLSDPDVSATLTPVLVDKLVALELPDRAEKLVIRLLAGTTSPADRGALGAKLASLRLDQGDGAGAVAALDQSTADTLPLPLQDRRSVLRARALVAGGQEDAALRVLASHDSEDATELRAQLFEKARDWRGAEAALQALAQRRLGKCGSLSGDQQDLVLRLASAASQAGDSGEIRALQAGCARQLSAGPRAALFQALTAQPVQAVTDLPRSGREAEAARALPAALARYDVH